MESITKDDLKDLRKQLNEDMETQRTKLNEDMETHVGVLYEKFSGEVKLVAEQVTVIDTRLQRVEHKTDLLLETVADIKVELTPLRESVGNHETRIKHLESAHAR